VLEGLRTTAAKNTPTAVLDAHDVIGDKDMTPLQELNGALGLADTGLPLDKDSQTININEDPMDNRGWG
jgi:hypothetical protein